MKKVLTSVSGQTGKACLRAFRHPRELCQARLLVASGEGEELSLEVAHEVLFVNWERLRKWLDEDREFLLWQKRLGALLTEWERAQESNEALVRGPLLIEAGKWFDHRTQDFSDQERRFISASRALRERLAQEERERQERDLEAARSLAEEQKRRAELSEKREKEQKEAAQKLEEGSRKLHVQLGNVEWLLGARARDNAMDVLRSGHHFLKGAKVFGSAGEAALATNATLAAALVIRTVVSTFPHNGPVHGAVFNRDESRILTWSIDLTARLWALGQNEPIQILEHKESINGAVFNHDESRILTWPSTDPGQFEDYARKMYPHNPKVLLPDLLHDPCYEINYQGTFALPFPTEPSHVNWRTHIQLHFCFS
jgi:hypothetical protein